MREVFIVSAVRTPLEIGAGAGRLEGVLPGSLAGEVIRAAIVRAGVKPAKVEAVWLAGGEPDLARQAGQAAGLPTTTPGMTLGQLEGAGQQAVHYAAQAILAGDMELAAAGGVGGTAEGAGGNPGPAEQLAEAWGLSREMLDDYARESHRRALQAVRRGDWQDQTTPMRGAEGQVVSADEGAHRAPTLAKLGALPPSLATGRRATAGNCCRPGAGAAALVLASPEAVGRYNLAPLARIEQRVIAGADPKLTVEGMAAAAQRALRQAELELEAIDLLEVNETSAAVVLAWCKAMGADLKRVNPNGGAIAHGNPAGASGAILMTKLAHELARRRKRYGMQVMEAGAGMALATIIERV